MNSNASEDAGSRFHLACLCGLVMYACAAGYAYVAFHGSKSVAPHMGVILGLPALAAILFLIVTLLVPNLLAPGKMVFPLNVTLPPVFAAIVVLTTILVTSTGNNLILPYEGIAIAGIWTDPILLFQVTLSQILCLTVLAMLKSTPVD